MAADFEQECFFIAPIGEQGTDVRKRSNDVRDWIVKPAAEAHGLETLRADDVGEPGQITSQAVQHCLEAKAAVADLTGGNPNVYYELSVRHGALLPVVLIAEEDTKLPFDLGQSRVIFFKHNDLASANVARQELETQLGASLTNPADNPISDGMRLAQLQGGNVEERTLGLIVDRLERLTSLTENTNQRLSRSEEASLYRTAIGRKAAADPDLVKLREQLVRKDIARDEKMREVRAEEEALSPGLTDDEIAELERERREVPGQPGPPARPAEQSEP
ncbi:MAG TPA: hypothetical protein VLL27_13485 [Solirubrobacterales bacterium]|nr:hypothetical protein [Solirubrobacterales bacterium]